MVKKYGNLYSDICDINNLKTAHNNARKGKFNYSGVKMVNKDVDLYINNISEMLKNKIYITSEYTIKKIYEPKERFIYKLPYYPDRIVHHATMQVLQPIWDNIFIYDLYSAIPGKGLHSGSNRLRYFLRDEYNTKYCLKFDITKYYPNINHDILFEIVKRNIKCKDTLWLLKELIYSPGGNKNLPIGNYLSQYLSNLYLNQFDHWIKEEKHMKYYIRYCDDAVILHNNKNFLKKLLLEIEEYLFDNLELTLNSKTQIFSVDKCNIDFLGYKHFRNYTLLRKSSARKLKRKIKHIENNRGLYTDDYILSCIMSYNGWIKHCNSYNLKKFLFYNTDIYDIYLDVIKNLGVGQKIYFD